MNYFSLFGLPPRYNIDTRELVSSFQNLQRRYHPDKFIGSPQSEKLAMLQKSAIINQAWQTLYNPLSRAEYLLALNGFNVKNEKCTISNVKFLTEQLLLRKELDRIEQVRDMVQLKIFIKRVKTMLDLCQQKVAVELDSKSWNNAVNVVYQLRFLDKLYSMAEQIEEKLLNV